jgi:hypothetical protein
VRIWHALQDEAKAKAAGYDQDSGITVRVADVTKPAEYVPTCCKISAHAMQIRATTRAIHPDMFISAEWCKFNQNACRELAKAIKGCDAVVCATGGGAVSPFDSRAKKVDNQGTKNLVDAALQADVKSFVLVSSLLTNAKEKGQSNNPNYIVLQLFGGVLEEKLQVLALFGQSHAERCTAVAWMSERLSVPCCAAHINPICKVESPLPSMRSCSVLSAADSAQSPAAGRKVSAEVWLDLDRSEAWRLVIWPTRDCGQRHC